MAADYAIAQFRFLERLLLVHGRWCYRRISLMVTISGLCSLSIAKRFTFIQRKKSKYTKVLSRVCINCKILKTPKSMRECAITYMVVGRQGFPRLTWLCVFICRSCISFTKYACLGLLLSYAIALHSFRGTHFTMIGMPPATTRYSHHCQFA